MRKILFLALICTVLFNACSKNECDLIDTEEVALSSSQTSKNIEDIMPLAININAIVHSKGFEKLNFIPEVISKKMDNEELKVWRKLSKKFYIDYNILNTTYYKKNKMPFLRSMEQLYEEVKNNGRGPAKLILLTEENSLERNVSLYNWSDTTEVEIPDPSIPDDTISIEDQEIHEEMCVKKFMGADSEIGIEFSSWLKVDGTKSNYTCSWTQLSWEVRPSGSTYFGNTPTMEPRGNILYLGVHGYIRLSSYPHRSVRIDEDGTLTYIIPQKL